MEHLSECFAGQHQQVLGDGTEGESREELKAAEDQDHAGQEADEQRPMGREGACRGLQPVLAASEPAMASIGTM